MQPFAHCALIIVRFACSVSKSCLTLCSTMDCSLPGSPVLGTLQARILERVAFPSPGHLPNPGIEPMSPVSPALAGRFFTTEPPKEALRVYLCSNKLSLYFLNLFASFRKNLWILSQWRTSNSPAILEPGGWKGVELQEEGKGCRLWAWCPPASLIWSTVLDGCLPWWHLAPSISLFTFLPTLHCIVLKPYWPGFRDQVQALNLVPTCAPDLSPTLDQHKLSPWAWIFKWQPPITRIPAQVHTPIPTCSVSRTYPSSVSRTSPGETLSPLNTNSPFPLSQLLATALLLPV